MNFGDLILLIDLRIAIIPNWENLVPCIGIQVAVNTFTCNWANENNWLVPPVSLAAR